ncbi:hypothetical protein [Pseudomonas sp. L13]|uniref:hypothetical protein n=1 Tax=Pseudomonas sp. L13 TaxID=343985 RepID=UPI001379CB5A|nr:hypothetical protein [Pseudomonas sp. L13]
MANKKFKAFRAWFTPKWRLRAGVVLLKITAVGAFFYPGGKRSDSLARMPAVNELGR